MSTNQVYIIRRETARVDHCVASALHRPCFLSCPDLFRPVRQGLPVGRSCCFCASAQTKLISTYDIEAALPVCAHLTIVHLRNTILAHLSGATLATSPCASPTTRMHLPRLPPISYLPRLPHMSLKWCVCVYIYIYIYIHIYIYICHVECG